MAKQTLKVDEKSAEAKGTEVEIIPAIPTLEEHISTELAKFNPTEQAIANYQEYMNLTVYGVDDKVGLANVHQARMEVKGKRIEVDKLRKMLNEDANKFVVAVNAHAKGITSRLTPIEDHLQAEEDRIQVEKDRIQEEKDRKEQERIQGRISQLTDRNMVFDGAVYSYGDVSIMSLFLKQCSDDQFEQFLARVDESQEEDRKKDEEEKRLEMEAKAEEERLRLEREAEITRKEEEQRQQAAALEQQRQELAAQQEELRKQLEAAKLERSRQRASTIQTRFSLVWDKTTESYHKHTFSITKDQIENLEPEEFNAMIEKFDTDVKAEDIRVEQEAEAEAKRRAEELLEQERLAEEQRKREEEEKERKRQEKEKRKLARRPDKEKVEAFVKNFYATVKMPEVKTDEYKELIRTFAARLKSAFDELDTTIEKIENGQE